MKSKALISVAVASALACSAAYAGSGAKHSAWIAPSDQQPSEIMTFVVEQSQTFANANIDESVGSTVSSAEGSIGSEDFSASSDEGASLHDSLALADQGIYSDYMIVSYTPMDWGYYVVDVDSTSDNSLLVLDSSMLDSGDYTLVSFTPIESWDYYVIDADQLAALDDFMIAPSDLMALQSSWFEDMTASLLEAQSAETLG